MNDSQNIDIREYMRALGTDARNASRVMGAASTESKNNALLAIARAIREDIDAVMAANERDLERGRANDIDAPLLDRLELTPARVDTMIEGLHQVAALQEPIGEVTDLAYRPSGIQVGKMRVPLGVIGFIYESRPNVTIEGASLCIKSGNALILRGGSEAFHSNRALADCVQKGLAAAGLPATAVQLVNTTDRQAVSEMARMDEFMDVIVPRGGRGLIERIMQESRVTVIKHLDGICHVYIDDAAELDMALDLAMNAKTQRYAVCNAMETLLVAESRAEELLPELGKRYEAAGVELRGCDRTRAILGESVCAATEDDWRAEYLGPTLAVRVVGGLDEAIEHINTFGSQHTDTIVTTNYDASWRFQREVDSSSVMVNVSTRFSDGFEYGLGAEIGISTDKIHARGPVGLEGLTSQKFVVHGDGQLR